MKVLKRLMLILFSLIIISLITAMIIAKVKAHKGLPYYGEDVKLKKLKDEVSVIRDQYGTPHIYAQDEEDLYRATGYLTAQDRMWQMDLLRRATTGRLSEVFGKGFEDTDILLRSLRYSQKSKKILTELPDNILLALEAYADGVNQYIKQYKGNYPLEFFILGYEPEKWEAYHSLNLINYMAWDLKAGWRELFLEELKEALDSTLYTALLPKAEIQKSYVFEQTHNKDMLANNSLLHLEKLDELGLDILRGSNNWAVSGKKSTTGMPIVANDMHLMYTVPGIWMQMHQVVEGKLNVSGLLLPGQPLVVVGHNDSIAWGMTNTYVDNLDYYEEKINPENSNQYLFNGEWKDFIVVKEQIKIKKDTVLELKYRYNHRGPVVSEAKGVKDKVLTIHWVGDEKSNELKSIYLANRAHNWSEFKEAFRGFKAISQNIVYGDKNGNIGLYACAGVPIRKRNAVFEILPGWTDEYDWKGLVPFEELPHEFNPERGYVSSANNRTVDSSYPYHIGSWYSDPYRIERIREMLEEKEKLSIGDFKAIQNDSKSKLAERIIQKCFKKLDKTVMSGNEIQVMELLDGWDGSMDKNLVQPAVLEYFRYYLIQTVYRDEMGKALFEKFYRKGRLYRVALFNLLESNHSPWIDNVETEPVETFSDVVQEAFLLTVKHMEAEYGDDIKMWKWGNIHTFTLEHPLSRVEILDKIFHLNRGAFPVSGSNHTIAPYSYPVNEPSGVHHGASHRHIYSLVHWDSTHSVIPTGNSGVVSSEFYCDQAEMYVNGEYHPDYFSKEAVENNAKYKMKIIPAE